MIQVPIFHVNAANAEAAYRSLQIALDYRKKFPQTYFSFCGVIGPDRFRRHGHYKTSDEPSYTQPGSNQANSRAPGVVHCTRRKWSKMVSTRRKTVDDLNEERKRRTKMLIWAQRKVLAREAIASATGWLYGKKKKKWNWTRL